jgi:chromosome segregation ATPase
MKEMADVIHMPSSSTGGKKQRKKLAKQEARLMLKVEQARKDVQKAQGKVAKAQSQLDDSQKRLQDIEGKLAALRTSPQEQQTSANGSEQTQEVTNQDTTSVTTTGTAQEQGEQGQQGQQLPANETYVGGAEDAERATTPYEAREDVLQAEGQELSQEHAVATDMAQAQDQGVVSVSPDNQDQNQTSD